MLHVSNSLTRGADRSTATGRHPSDAIRLGAAAVLLAVCLLAVRRDSLTTFEIDVFRLVNDLPEWLRPSLVMVMQLGNVVAAFVVGAAFLLRRKVRPALDVALSGAAAWVVAKLIKDWIGRPRPGGLIDEVERLAEEAGRGFVSGHAAVAFAIATAAAPHVPRRWRRAAFLAACVVGAARIYEGAHLPLDIVGGAALGWGLAALLHVLAGAPHQRPTTADAARVLARAGFGECEVSRVGGEPRGSFPFLAIGEMGPVFIKLLDPEARDQDLLYRAARFLSLRDLRDDVRLRDPLAQAEHEATMALLARQAGVHVPSILRVQQAGGQVWLIQEWVGRTSLEGAEARRVTASLLTDLWRELDRLHGAGIAHRDLDPTNVVIDDDERPWIVDFAHAAIDPPSHAFDNDIAQLLLVTALMTEPEGALQIATQVLGRDRVSRAASELQLLALPHALRDDVRRRPQTLHRLRELLATDAARAVQPSGPVQLVARPSALAALALSVVVVLTVGGKDDVLRVLTTGSWRWAALTCIGAFVAATAHAAALVLTIDRPVALGRATATVIAAESTAVIDGRSAAEQTVSGFLVANGVAGDAATGHVEWLRRARVLIALMGLPLIGGAAALDNATITSRWQGVALIGAALAIAASTREPMRRTHLRWVAPSPVGAASVVAMTVVTALVLMAAVEVVGGAAAVTTIGVTALISIVLVEGLGAHPNTRALLWAAGLTVVGVPVASAAAAAIIAVAALSWIPALAGVAFAHPLRRYLVG